jgi:hypothetical protein
MNTRDASSIRAARLALATGLSLGTALWSARAGAEPAETDNKAPEFVYQPFTSVPQLDLIANPFAGNLVSACAALRQATFAAAAPGAEVAPSADALGAALDAAKQAFAQQAAKEAEHERARQTLDATEASTPAPTAALRTAAASERNAAQASAATAAAAARQASKETDAKLAALEAQLALLREACAAMGSVTSDEAKPLKPTHIELLRELRDAPEQLALLAHWGADDQFARQAFGEALAKAGELAGTEGASSAFSVSGDAVIRGLAEFIADRAKQEAMRYAEKQLAQRLCNATAKPFFANTCEALDALDEQQPLHALGVTVRAAAEADLRALPDVALAYSRHRGSDAGLVLAGRSLLALGREAWGGRAPFDVLAAFGTVPLSGHCADDAGCTSVLGALQRASALAYALRQGGESLRGKQLGPSDAGVVGVAVLLLTEARLHATSGPALATDLLTTKLAAATQLVLRVVAMHDRWHALTQPETELSAEERRRRAVDAVTATIADVSFIVQALAELEGRQVVAAAYPLMRTIGGVTSKLASRQYGAAVIALAVLMKPRPESGGKLLVELPASVERLLPLAAELANARSSSEVAAVFESHAAPLGSYEDKYRRPLIALNAMVGGHAGGELIAGDEASGTSAMVAGFAPVGVHLTTPVGCAGDDGMSPLHFGALVGLIDLGALTTYRFKRELEPEQDEPMAAMAEPTVEHAPEIGFGQIFAPGVYLTLGLFETPLVLGAGASFTPALREVTDSALDVREDAAALRFGAFLAVDVPILPL